MTAPLDRFAGQLDWNLLRTFMVIVQERSITLAANRLSVTQPSVSAALRRLEDRLERRLIERGGATQFRVTEAGEVLYRHCAEIYGSIATLPNALDATRATIRGTVGVLVANHVYWPELGLLIADFRKEFPLVRFRIRHQPCDEIIAALTRRETTLGVISRREARPALKYSKIFDQPMGFYGLTGGLPDAIEDAPLIDFGGEAGEAGLDAMAVYRVRAGLHGPVVVEGSDCAAVADLIRAGIGIGPLPCRFAGEHASLTALPLDPAPPLLPVHLVCHEQMHFGPAEQRFIHHLTLAGLCPPSWSWLSNDAANPD